MTNETKHMIEELKLKKELKERHDRNVRSFSNYFRNSGKVEQTQENLGMWVSRERKKYGNFLTPVQIERDKLQDKFDEKYKTLEIDLNKHIKKDDKENW
tara:strand:- start:4617 stop:4913 length:297 start_codon:yes stop_codon:yes gene_type:complete